VTTIITTIIIVITLLLLLIIIIIIISQSVAAWLLGRGGARGDHRGEGWGCGGLWAMTPALFPSRSIA
jgi:hypothetical protein